MGGDMAAWVDRAAGCAKWILGDVLLGTDCRLQIFGVFAALHCCPTSTCCGSSSSSPAAALCCCVQGDKLKGPALPRHDRTTAVKAIRPAEEVPMSAIVHDLFTLTWVLP